MKKIILTTLNARYIHPSIGLRSIFANLKDLRENAEIIETGIKESIYDAAERILKFRPYIVGIGVYIWNALETRQLVSIIKKVSPETIIVLGGPEVSHFPIRVDFGSADYIIQGEAEISFYKLCRDLIDDSGKARERIIQSEVPDTLLLELPYRYYTDNDIKNRVIYLEASRGCPFRCEFCLSSLDKSVRYFDTELLLEETEGLWNRGARHFKFIDRTFNINLAITNRILDYFLEKDPEYFLHFEVVPDHLDESTKERLKKFPAAALQLEAGIQTLNGETASRISRGLNFKKIRDNLSFIENETKIHMHADLIIGLPGETLESFAENLNILSSLTNAEIQLGILKKLSGTSISRHDEVYGMIYSDLPPYEILQNNLISYEMMQKMKRFTRFWDLTYNSGNFKNSVKMLWQRGDVFGGFFEFSEWIYAQTESTWQISLLRIAELLFRYLTEVKKMDKTASADTIIRDISKITNSIIPGFLKEHASFLPIPEGAKGAVKQNKRQIRHL